MWSIISPKHFLNSSSSLISTGVCLSRSPSSWAWNFQQSPNWPSILSFLPPPICAFIVQSGFVYFPSFLPAILLFAHLFSLSWPSRYCIICPLLTSRTLPQTTSPSPVILFHIGLFSGPHLVDLSLPQGLCLESTTASFCIASSFLFFISLSQQSLLILTPI